MWQKIFDSIKKIFDLIKKYFFIISLSLLFISIIVSILVKYNEIFNIFSDVGEKLAQWFASNDMYWLLFAIFIFIISITYNKIYKWISHNFDHITRRSRHYQVVVASSISLSILIAHILFCFTVFQLWGRKPWEIKSFWTLGTLLISAPVAFVIWRFRDENQSKDINLKEFQKIAEWVSGMHFPDNHIEISKTTTVTSKPVESDTSSDSNLEKSTEEKITETTKKPVNADLFSKRSGAESLQIAAIYNLLPFYRGDHGTSFEKPAVNLLKSIWAMMQQDLLQQLNELEQDKTKAPAKITEQQKQICQELQNRANSPLGQAITRVWMACDHNGNLLIHRHPEIFAGLCLSGMSFGLAGLEIDTLREKLFTGRNEQGKSFDYSGIQLQAGNFPENKSKQTGFNFSGCLLKRANFLQAELLRTNLEEANLEGANLEGANLEGAKLKGAKLDRANLNNTKLLGASLYKVNLEGANLLRANLYEANLERAKLFGANLEGANLERANLERANLERANLWRANLYEASLEGAKLLEAKLFGANLERANLRRANLERANLERANLRRANLERANLWGVNLARALITKNQIINYDLFISDEIELKNTFIVIPSNVDTTLQQALVQKGAIIAVEGNLKPSFVTIRCTNKQNQEKIEWEGIFINIDLSKTQALNPDWEIEIIKE